MASPSNRTFEDYDASTSTKSTALMIGITSPSSGGKTYSALRLATGIQRIVGGDIGGIDTESDRMLHYKHLFKFRHVPFAPPFNPLSYALAIDHCISKGMRVIIVDSMSHEHTGDGGVLDSIDAYLGEKVAHKKPHESDYEVRERYKWAAQIPIKAERRRLNEKIRQIGSKAVFIFCYRADDKTKPVSGGKPVHVGWQAETTSKLPYDMTVRFLLPPASDGHPNLNPDTEFEKLSIKMPGIFRDWFKPGLQLSEELGERLARWAMGDSPPPPSQKPAASKLVSRLVSLAVGIDAAEAEARILARHLDDAGLTAAGMAIKGGASFDEEFPKVAIPGEVE